MRIFVFCAAMFAATVLPAYADDCEALPAAGNSQTQPAPADEYFGRLKMSILGIRNELARLEQRVEAGAGDDVLDSAGLTEESIKEWETRYPSDPWLAKTVYMLVHVYNKVPTQAGHENATRALQWLLSKYGQTEFANRALNEVGQQEPPSQ